MRVLTWNLFHGRAVPPAGRELLHDFADALTDWPWDVALLQEVPPWWPVVLARACGAQERTALTSRNGLLPLRRVVARRWPDILKSSGGGANSILVRGQAIEEHRRALLRRRPERRVVHAVNTGELWVANLHAQVRPRTRAEADVAAAARHVLAWAGTKPAVLGGDMNVPRPQAPGFTPAGGHGVDHVLVRGLRPTGPAQVLDRDALSDHAPVLVDLIPEAGESVSLARPGGLSPTQGD
jgi:endonuclease/exonuclease/phosphatase family metal-dependent hydrolase